MAEKGSVQVNAGVNYRRVQQPPGAPLLAGSVIFLDANPLYAPKAGEEQGEGVPLSEFDAAGVTWRAVVNGQTVGSIAGNATYPARLGPATLTEKIREHPQVPADAHGLYLKLKYEGIGPGTFGLRFECDVTLKDGTVLEGEYTFSVAD